MGAILSGLCFPLCEAVLTGLAGVVQPFCLPSEHLEHSLAVRSRSAMSGSSSPLSLSWFSLAILLHRCPRSCCEKDKEALGKQWEVRRATQR